MDYSKVLNEKFSRTKIFFGVKCGEQYVRKVDGSIFSKWCNGAEDSIFCAYKLLNCSSMQGESVAAGFFIMRKAIVAYGYEVAGRFKVTLVKRPLYADDLDRVLGDLVKMMERDETIGSDFVVKLGTMEIKEAVLKSADCIACEETRGKIFKIDDVVVNFGFNTMPMSLLLGCSNGIFAACLSTTFLYTGKDGRHTVYIPKYETVFTSGKDGNNFFVALKKRVECTKDGYVFHRMDSEEFFNLFYKVSGVSFNLEGSLCG